MNTEELAALARAAHGDDWFTENEIWTAGFLANDAAHIAGAEAVADSLLGEQVEKTERSLDEIIREQTLADLEDEEFDNPKEDPRGFALDEEGDDDGE